jgi:hypothetical protein
MRFTNFGPFIKFSIEKLTTSVIFPKILQILHLLPDSGVNLHERELFKFAQPPRARSRIGASCYTRMPLDDYTIC